MRWFTGMQILLLAAATLHCGERAPTQGGVTKAEVATAADAPPPAQQAEGPGTLAKNGGSPTPVATPGKKDFCQQDLASSRYVACQADGKLRYALDRGTGAALLDYSAVGYHGGDDPLPNVPVHQHLAPSGKDDTAQLQAAINAVSARAADSRGLRGRLVLAPGLFRVNRTLLFAKSGVAVEGTASVGPKTTTIQLTGSATTLFHVRGSGNAKTSGTAYPIERLPVPAGSSKLTLHAAQGLKVGDLVRVTSSRNIHWITKMWGGKYPPERDGKAQSAWGERMQLQMPRTIVAIDGDTITLDVPLPDTIPHAEEADAAGATVQKLDVSNYLREFGIAHMRLVGRFVGGDISSPKLLQAITVENAEDGYIDDIEATDFGAGTVDLGAWTRHVTVQDVRSIRSGVQEGGAKPFDINLRGQLHLVQGCASSGNKTFYVATQTTDAAGPNVVQNYRAAGAGTFEPHQRWSTGVLFDNIYVPDGGIALIDRASAGSGHGWSMGYGAVYNSLAGTHNRNKMGMNSSPGLTINQPPMAANWGIGLIGPNHSTSTKDVQYDSPGKPVAPASLYAQQLYARRGSTALGNVMGPWQLQQAASGLCMAVDVAKAGAFLVLRDCHAMRQRALWDITSRGSLRLGGTNLCMDAASDRRNTPVKLAACVDDAEQHWSIGERGGAATEVQLQADSDGDPACLGSDNKTATVVPCAAGSKGWNVVVSHLAR